MKKTPIFLIVLFFMTILIPQVCAQGESVSPEEAAARRTKFVDYAKQCIGKPYARGAIGPDAFDCSGLVFTCSRESIGVQLPRQTKAIYAFCTIIDESEREIGDLVFFKTTGDDTVSHVGIYVGNAQFIHAASDGQNTGVILSSLRENYWKSHYFQTGRFLPASGLERMVDPKSDSAPQPTAQTASAGAADSVAANTATADGAGKRGSFLHKIILDASLTFDWNFFTADSFQISPRGGSTMLHAMYDGGTFRPGVGSMICVNAKMGVVQLPIIVSLTLGDYFRFFFGPVITIGTPELPAKNATDVKASFFPGILGVCWQSPSFGVGKTRVSFQQDVHYTFFNDTDGTVLSLKNSIVSGLVFSTGVRVTMPLANVL
ncbi:MAG: C40 family peptidase [Treponemataceae bacterium]|nr:C40 family peptidase [Treponemataceae bacterium]